MQPRKAFCAGWQRRSYSRRWPNSLAPTQRSLLVSARQHILAIERPGKLVFARKGEGANGDTERKIGGISERSPGTPERRAACFSIERIEPGSSG